MHHPVEIRKRAVDAYLDGVGTYDSVAQLFQVGSASLKRWVARMRQRNHVDPIPYVGGPAPTINSQGLALLKKWIEKRSDFTLEELCIRYNNGNRQPVSVSTIGRAVRNRLKLPRKKKHTVPHNATRKKTNY